MQYSLFVERNWALALREFREEIAERKTFSRQYSILQDPLAERAYEKEYKWKLGSWKPFIDEAAQSLNKQYILKDYDDTELEGIIKLLNEAMIKTANTHSSTTQGS